MRRHWVSKIAARSTSRILLEGVQGDLGGCRGTPAEVSPLKKERQRRILPARVGSRHASIGICTTTEEMDGRAPGVMSDPVQPSGSIDPRKCVRRRQLAWGNGCEDGGAMVALQDF